MSDLEIAEELNGSALDGLFSIEVGLENAEASIEAALEDINSELKLPEERTFKFNSIVDGDVILDFGNVSDVNMTEFRADLNNGNFEDAYNRLNLDLSSDEGKDFLENQKNEYNKSPSGQMKNSLDENIDYGNDNDLGPEPTSKEDFENKMRENGAKIDELNRKFDTLQKKLEESKIDPEKDPKRFEEKFSELAKDFFKGLLKLTPFLLLLGVLALAAKDLYDYIKKVQHAYSGCWSTIGNTHCKIAPLTCKDDDIVSQSVKKFALCKPYGTQGSSCKVNNGELSCTPSDNDYYFPIKLSMACACDPTGNIPMLDQHYNYLAETSYNPCNGFNSKCPSKENFIDKIYQDMAQNSVGDTPPGDQNAACPYGSGCIARKDACKGKEGDDCSPWCSTSLIKLRKGQTLSCKKCNFWCAFNSIVGDVIPSNTISKILHYLIMAAMIIAGIIIGFILLKFALNFFSDQIEEHESSGTDHTDHKVSIEVTAKSPSHKHINKS